MYVCIVLFFVSVCAVCMCFSSGKEERLMPITSKIIIIQPSTKNNMMRLKLRHK